MQEDEIVTEFTQQAEAFNTSAVANDAAALDQLLRVVGPESSELWLDVACGPGIVSRTLAPLVREVHGVDLTPAMVEVARREARAAGVGNATFEVGDATALALPDASVDGAVARFAIHHIPMAGRLFQELARVVRPGGHVILADHIADEDAEAAAWSQEVERLRDPSHWACLTVPRMWALAGQARLAFELERLVPLELDFGDWLGRASGGPSAAALIERAVAERPEGTECFRLAQRDGRRVLRLRMWASRWRRPG